MKLKMILILLIVALLCTSIVSAGFFDWVTGKAVSLKSLFSKNAVNANNAALQAKQPSAVSPVEVSKTKISPTEFDSTPAAYSGDQLLVHVENRLRQMENNLKMTDERMGARA